MKLLISPFSEIYDIAILETEEEYIEHVEVKIFHEIVKRRGRSLSDKEFNSLSDKVHQAAKEVVEGRRAD